MDIKKEIIILTMMIKSIGDSCHSPFPYFSIKIARFSHTSAEKYSVKQLVDLTVAY